MVRFGRGSIFFGAAPCGRSGTKLHSDGQDGNCTAPSHPIHWKRHEPNVLTGPPWMLNGRALVAAGGATSAAAELVAGYLRELGARPIVVIAENLAREQVHKVEMLPTPDTGTGSYLSLSLRNLFGG